MPSIFFTHKYRKIRQQAIITFATLIVGFGLRQGLAKSGIWNWPPSADELLHVLLYPGGVAFVLLWLWILPDAFEARSRRNAQPGANPFKQLDYESFEELWPRVSFWKPMLIGLCIGCGIELKIWMAELLK
jgi:hypothetical protein